MSDIEQQDPETGEWSDETPAETAAADEAGTPVAEAEPAVEEPAPAADNGESWWSTHNYPPPE